MAWKCREKSISLSSSWLVCVCARKILNFYSCLYWWNREKGKNMLGKENKQFNSKVVRMSHQSQPSFRSFKSPTVKYFIPFRLLFPSHSSFLHVMKNLRGNFKSLCASWWFIMVLSSVALMFSMGRHNRAIFKRVGIEKRFSCFHVYFLFIALRCCQISIQISISQRNSIFSCNYLFSDQHQILAIGSPTIFKTIQKQDFAQNGN